MMQKALTTRSPDFSSSRSESLLILLGLAASLVCIQLAGEGIVHFDDLTHYLYAKWAWRWPQYLLDDWGRPGFTALYFPFAALGWKACRILSALLSAGAAWFGCGVARRMGLRPAWPVALLIYLQPLFFQLSQTTLTETALAFYLTFALWLAQRGRWSLSAAIISLGFVTRHEAVLFLPVWIWYARRERVPLWRLWPIIWAPLIVNGIGALAGTRPPIVRLFEPKPSTQYGAGGWLTFFCRSMEAFGPGITILAITGFVRTWRLPRGAMPAACIAIYFGGQTAIRALGLYDSGGYARFLIPISPLVAICALSGWRSLCSRDMHERGRAVAAATIAAVVLWLSMERQVILYAAGRDEVAELPELHQALQVVRIAMAILSLVGVLQLMTVMSVAILHTHRERWPALMRALIPTLLAALIALAMWALAGPLPTPSKVLLVRETLTWLRAHGYGDRPVLSAHVWIDYATGQELPWNRSGVRDRLMNAPPGTLFIWEQQFAGSIAHAIPLEMLTTTEVFEQVYASPPEPYHKEPYLYVFEKVGPGGKNWNRGTILPLSASDSRRPGGPVAASRPDR